MNTKIMQVHDNKKNFNLLEIEIYFYFGLQIEIKMPCINLQIQSEKGVG